MNKIWIIFGVIFLYKLLINLFSIVLLAFIKSKYNEIPQNQIWITVLNPTFEKLVVKAQGWCHSSLDDNSASVFTTTPDDEFISSFGIYANRILECFNPFYWCETILYLPKNIVKYLGFPNNTLFVKTMQLLWWFITPLAIVFRKQVVFFILKLFP